MNISVKLSMEKGFMDSPRSYSESRIAAGYVEIESAFKFPVSILRANRDGNQHLFVKFPSQAKSDGTYSNIVFPVDQNVRKEVEDAVFREFRALPERAFSTPPITDVRVTVLKEPVQSGTVMIKGYASLMVSGFAVNGIAVKESSKGLFVQMPQYRDAEGKYHDVVYGTNISMQEEIRQAVLEAYEKTVQPEIQKEKNMSPVPKTGKLRKEENEIDIKH